MNSAFWLLLLASLVLSCIGVGSSATVLSASYRKDHYLKDFKESGTTIPTDGGRVHAIVTGSNCSQPFTSVKVNGQEALNLDTSQNPDFTYFDWARAHGTADRVWVSFHSRNTKWLADKGTSSLQLQVSDAQGKVCFTGSAAVAPGMATRVAYATTRNNGKEFVVHIHNDGPNKTTVKSIEINGQAAEASSFDLHSGQTKIIVQPMQHPLSAGEVWTVSINTQGGPGSQGWGGRVIPETFPIEAWPKSSDCPIPGGNKKNWEMISGSGIDTLYIRGDDCGSKDDTASIISDLAKNKSPAKVWTDPKCLGKISNTGNVGAVLIGDEVDGHLDSNLRTKLADALTINKQHPTIPTYQGGKTNANIGAYCGMTDIQGMDAYNSACAPTIIPVTHSFPIQYPYYYLKNARDNHAPLPSYLYSQLYSEAWSYQANSNELTTQLGMTVLAGAKGITLFQTVAEDIKQHDFATISRVMQSIRTLGETFRTGDIQGLKFKTSASLNKEVMIEVIRSPDKVVVVVINTNAKGYSNLICHTAIVDRHWTFSKLKIDSIQLVESPVKLKNFQEVVNGSTVGYPSDVNISITSDGAKLSNIKMDDKLTVRFFTFDVASSEDQKLDADAAPRVVNIVQSSEKFSTSGKSPDRLRTLDPVVFSPNSSSKVEYTIKVDPTKPNQDIMGFGGAFTDSVASVFSQLNKTLQEQVIGLLWGPNGQKYNMARLTIGATDFSTTVYNYNEKENDFNQDHFSIAHDKAEIIPLIQRAMKASTENGGDDIRFVSSSWSPPGWMKRAYLALKGHMRNSAKPGMIDDPKMYKSYALYLSKYISAYQAAGVPVNMMTIQNEPDSADHMVPVAYPACNFNGTGEGEFLRDYLGPQMKQDHPDVKIFVHDGQKFHDVPILDRVNHIVKAAGGKNYIDGVAFHWYGNNLKNYQFLQELREAHPDLLLLGTEATLEAPDRQHIGTSPWKEAQKYSVDIIGDLNAGATGWIEWNVLLDMSGGPTCIGPTGNDYCTPIVGHCDAPILADTKNQTIEIRDTFWNMAHFSRFIPRGSKHIDITGAVDTNTTFVATSVITTDSKVVVVALNTDGSNTVDYQLDLGGAYASLSIPPHSIQTLTVDMKKQDRA